MQYKQIRYVKLAKSELETICPILDKASRRIRELAVIFNETNDHRKFRGKLIHDIRLGSFKKLDTSKFDTEQMAFLNAAILDIKAAMQYEDRLVSGYANLVRKQSHAVACNAPDSMDVYYDCEQEGFIGVVDAMYGYDASENTKLITYVWRCIRNALSKQSNRLNPMRPLTNQALKLVECFNRERERLSTLGPITDEEVITQLEITEKEKSILRDATRRVYGASASEAKPSGISSMNHDEDYSSFRRDIDNDVADVFLERREVRQAFKDANLEPVELDAAVCHAFPFTGWQEDVASRHINPKTGQRYTRAAIGGGILERAHRKITNALKQPAAVPVTNEEIDRLFDELSGKFAK